MQRLTYAFSALAIVLLVGVVCGYIPNLFTGTAPSTPEGDVPLGAASVLKGISPVVIADFWPLAFSVWFAFCPLARLSFAVLVLLGLLVSACLAENVRELVSWGLVLVLAVMLVINMVGIFHIF